jgi:hypothetical protein
MALHQFDIIEDPTKEKTQHPKSFWLPVEIALFTLLAFLAFAPIAAFGSAYSMRRKSCFGKTLGTRMDSLVILLST